MKPRPHMNLLLLRQMAPPPKTETFTLDVTDLTLAFSASIASATQGESLATGATIASSSSTDAEGTVTYTLTDRIISLQLIHPPVLLLLPML